VIVVLAAGLTFVTRVSITIAASAELYAEARMPRTKVKLTPTNARLK